MEIREAKPDEAGLVAEIYRSDIGKFGTDYTGQDVERIFRGVGREFEKIGQDRVAFLGFENTRPIGVVQLIFNKPERPELADGKDIAHVHHLRVAYDTHKKGVGGQLMETVEQYAKEHGFSQITLEVDDWNENAIKFYKNRGYGVVKEVIEKNGDRLLLMSKQL